MELQTVEQVIMDRFYEKARMAGGPRTGYMLRKQTVVCLGSDHPELDFEAGVASLVDKGLLMPNEGGDLLYLTETGSEALSARRA